MAKAPISKVIRPAKPAGVLPQLSVQLKKLHATVPFPHSTDEVVRALLPELPSREDDDRVANLELSMKASTLVHAAIVSRENWSGGDILVGDANARVFYMYTQAQVPAPPSFKVYRVFESLPQYQSLLDWYERAAKLEAEIEAAMDFVQSVGMAVGNSPILLKRVWPALGKFWTGQLISVPPTGLARAKLATRDMLASEQAHKVTDMLATASLLENAPRRAWVSFAQMATETE